MSRVIRVGLVAGLLAAGFAVPSASAAPPCEVRVENRYIGGTTWTAIIIWPVVDCG